jgi:ketosteroid isomerase-like protein
LKGSVSDVASDIFSPKTLGEAIRLLQDRAGINREQFARACGVSPASITNYLAGNTTPQAAVLRRMSNELAQLLNVDPVHLWVELGGLVDVSPPSGNGRRSIQLAEDIHRRIGEALSAGDAEGLLDLCTDDIVIHIPGRNPFSGEFRGKDGARTIAGMMMQLSGGETKFEAELISATNQHAVHVHRARMKVGAELMDMRSLIICFIRDGKISEVWIYPEDQYLVDDFWA